MRTDAQLVTAAGGDDGVAFAELYDRYADRIHAFCYGRLRTDADAADALRETFLRAHHRWDEIDDPARFRPWLFAIARTTVVELARVRGRHGRRRDWGPIGGPSRPTAPDRRDPDSPGTGDRLLAEESSELLWIAATALLPRDQELVELHLREGLQGSDLAEAMAVEPARLHVMVKRLKVRLSGAVGSLLVARVGRQRCADLDAMLIDWNGTYSLAIRSTVTRHVEACPTCHTTLDEAISWSAVAAAMPAPSAPPSVRVAVMAAVSNPALGVVAAAAVLPTLDTIGPGANGADTSSADTSSADETPAIVAEAGGAGLGTAAAVDAESGGAIGSALLYLALAITGVGLLTWVALRDDDSDVVATQVEGSEEAAETPRDTADASDDTGPGGITTADPSPIALAPPTSDASSTTTEASGRPSETTRRSGPPGPGPALRSPPTSSPTGSPTSSRAGSSTSLPRSTSTTPASTTTTITATTTASTTTTTIAPRPAKFSGSRNPIDFTPGTESVTYTFSNRGDLPLSWTASTTGPFAIDTPQGTLIAASSITVAVILDPGLPQGDHEGRLRFDTDGDGKSDVVIVLSATVAEPGAPASPSA